MLGKQSLLKASLEASLYFMALYLIIRVIGNVVIIGATAIRQVVLISCKTCFGTVIKGSL